MNNKTAVDIFHKMKELNKLKDISEDENEEINSEALLRKLRRTKDDMAIKGRNIEGNMKVCLFPFLLVLERKLQKHHSFRFLKMNVQV